MSADPRDGPPGAVGRMPTMDVPTAAGLALGAVADGLLADPRRRHPVAGFGTVALALERQLWRDARANGVAYAGLLTAGAAALGAALSRATAGHPLARTAVTAGATWTVLGGTSLGRAAGTMHRHLADGDLAAARA